MRPGLGSSPRGVVFTLAACLLLVSVTACRTASAQEGVPQGGVLKLNSRLVTLDISVLDAKGNAVTNLTQSDFNVFENGEHQSIRNFEGFSTHELTPTLAANSINGAADLERRVQWVRVQQTERRGDVA